MGYSSPARAFGSPVAEFLTPRTKVARTLADIDGAPTPSPTDRPTIEELENELLALPSSSQTERCESIEEQECSHPPLDRDQLTLASDTDDADDAVRRPQGRAARRMLGEGSSAKQASSPPNATSSTSQINGNEHYEQDEDLYSATPVGRLRRNMAVSGSPLGSDRGNGLFVSPNKSTDNESDDELPANPFVGKDRLSDLIARKRAEHQAKEADSEASKKQALAHTSSDAPEEEDFVGSQEPVDPNIERIVSDATRPPRKASKKALLEMERETQRLARQQALAHQTKVKRKFTTDDLFAKINFRRPGASAETINEQSGEGDTTASSVANSDGVEERAKGLVSTPPSTPPTPLDKQKELVDQGALSKLVPVRQDSIASIAEFDDDEYLPDLTEVLRASELRKATQPPQTEEVQQQKKGLKLARMGKKAMVPKYDSSDDELEIICAMPAHLRAFEKAAGSKSSGKPVDSKAIHNLKHLSHLHNNDAPPQKNGSRPSLHPKTLETQLRRRAKEQARQQQLERIKELRDKGIEVQSVEERDREAEDFENLLEKARQEAVKLRKAEQAAIKDALGDGSMMVSGDEEADAEYEDSASELDEMEDEEGEQEENDLVDEAAEETDDGEEDSEGGDEETEMGEITDAVADEDGEKAGAVQEESDAGEEDVTAPVVGTRKSRKSHIVMDEDDELDDGHEVALCNSPIAEQDEDEDPFAAFNFGAATNAAALLSPTQVFNATMQTPTQASQDDSFDILRRIAPPSISSLPTISPDVDAQLTDATHVNFVAVSQVPQSQRINFTWESQPPQTPVPTGSNRAPSALSETPDWEPSQDPGLPSPWSVKLRRESTLDSVDNRETQSTVRLRISESPSQSQPAPKRGRLLRGKAAGVDSDDEANEPPATVALAKKDVFREMARRRKEALTAVEREEAETEMRQMMDEQADESDDEYAGLGGDDFVAPETEQDRAMIDSSHVEVDERALAAHFAERQRMKDEAETSKLYKDLTTGVLRRKMGANAFDLDEDEDELAVKRRQMRQREEARKRKALLKDENIATLAEGKQSKGKDAFLRAIADDDGDEEIVNLSDKGEESVPTTQDENQQSQSQQEPIRALQQTSGNKRKALEDVIGAEGEPAPKQRRTQVSTLRTPTSLLEVKESVSFLLDEPHAAAAFGPTALELGSDTDNDEPDAAQVDDSDDDALAIEQARVNDGGFAPNPASMDAKIMPPPRLPASQRRTAPKPAVVDRLSLKRGSSASNNINGRTAWAAGPMAGAFKAPSLLRRATTSIASGANDRGVSTPTLSRENSGVKVGGSKKSSLAYQARADERRAIVEASAKRREENTARIAQMRRNSSALSRGLSGRFE